MSAEEVEVAKNAYIAYIQEFRKPPQNAKYLKNFCDYHIPQFIVKYSTAKKLLSNPPNTDVSEQKVPTPYTYESDEAECNKTAHCVMVQRVMRALDFFESCNDEQFDKFCFGKNGSLLLNDYHHLIMHHDHHLEEVNDFVLKNNNYKCNIKTCKSFRHRIRRESQSTENSASGQLSYFKDLSNQIHVHLVHSFTTRIRPSVISSCGDSTSDIKHDDVDIDIVEAAGKQFEKVLKLVNQQRESTGDHFGRIESNKFNISLTQTSTKTKEFGVFESGFRFYYWGYYKDNDTAQHTAQYAARHAVNDSDRLLTYKELYVGKKYENFKEEMAKNKACPLSMEDFQRSMAKCQEFLKSNTGKALKSMIKDSYYHYEIEKRDKISTKHILAIIFYTDYSILSSSFSSTFRSINGNESLESIKNRNREFANWSKAMRECVELFGDKISKHPNMSFYCGMSRLLLKSFAIRLNGPTSTTTQWAKAMNFVQENGILITLNKAVTFYAGQLRYFHSQLVSQYVDEEEYTFIGGFSAIRVSNLTLKINANWCDLGIFCRAIYYFENMISGVDPTKYHKRATKVHNRIIQMLIELKVNGIRKNGAEFVEYVDCLFPYFCDNKELIIIHLDAVNTFFSTIKNNIFFDNNILDLPKIVRIFPALKTIKINDINPEITNEFDIFEFISLGSVVLNNSKDNKLTKIILSVNRKKSQDKYEKSWLVTQYEGKIQNINFKNVSISYKLNCNVDVLTIAAN